MKGLESNKRTDKNVQDFRERLKLLRPGIKIEDIKERQPEKQDPTGGLVGVSIEQVKHRHRWLTSMDEFADFIQNVDPPLPLHEPVTIALIDDGVDINEQSLHAKIIGGRSFCPRDSSQNLNKPYYITTGGHGTVMASLICRVCPKAQLYVLKLDEHVSEHSTRTITAKSAAKVRPAFSSPSAELDVNGLANTPPTGRSSGNSQKSSHHLHVLDDRAHPAQRDRYT